MSDVTCSICGGADFRQMTVLWDELAAEWQLSISERSYVDEQQGFVCNACQSSLRVMALGNAIRAFTGTPWPLQTSIARGEMDALRVLDCNGADGISTVLSALPLYRRIDYPEYDMRRLPFEDASFDLIVHSDTLEHIEHPVSALQECRRLLAPGGRLCFTVPIIHGRLSRNRAGLPPSYHGNPSVTGDDFKVHTEFGADAYRFVYEAGFTSIMLNQLRFPSALAISAWSEPPVTPPA